ncbi:MAG: polyprenyl synthetase family protein [Vampirovibrionales bacterium]
MDSYAHKTGALFGAAMVCGALLAQAPPSVVNTLEQVGHLWGQAFQLADDVLDVTIGSEQLGKPAGQDATHGKVGAFEHIRPVSRRGSEKGFNSH